MQALGVSPVSVGAALGICNAPLAVAEQVLENADYGFVLAGVALAIVALVRGYGRMAPREGLADAAQPLLFPPELLFIPVLAYLGTTLVAVPLLSHWFPQPAVAEGTPEGLDLGALLGNNLALFVGGVACWVVGRRTLPVGGASMFTQPKRALRDLAVGAGGALVAIGVCQLVLYVTCQVIFAFSPDYAFPEHGVIEALRDPRHPDWLPGVFWLGVAVVTPAAEELFFRGVLLRALEQGLRSRWKAIAATAALFGCAHLTQPQVVPALAVFGVILALLHYRTGGLLAPIVAHALFNAKTLLWEALR